MIFFSSGRKREKKIKVSHRELKDKEREKTLKIKICCRNVNVKFVEQKLPNRCGKLQALQVEQNMPNCQPQMGKNNDR